MHRWYLLSLEAWHITSVTTSSTIAGLINCAITRDEGVHAHPQTSFFKRSKDKQKGEEPYSVGQFLPCEALRCE